MKSSSRWFAALAVAVLSTSLARHACGEAIEMFGYDHEPLGSAVLTAEPSSLLVGNLDSSGNSGVSIDLHDLAYEQYLWLADLEDLGSPTSHADGSFIELTSIGRVNGLSHQKLGVGRFEAVGGQVQISVDLSNATADPIYIEYRLGGPFGTLVTTENLSTRSFTGLTASSFPVSIADDVVYAGGFAKITMGAAFASAEALITPSGTLVVADWFDVFGVSETFDGFQKTTIVTGAISRRSVLPTRRSSHSPNQTASRSSPWESSARCGVRAYAADRQPRSVLTNASRRGRIKGDGHRFGQRLAWCSAGFHCI